MLYCFGVIIIDISSCLYLDPPKAVMPWEGLITAQYQYLTILMLVSDGTASGHDCQYYRKALRRQSKSINLICIILADVRMLTELRMLR